MKRFFLLSIALPFATFGAIAFTACVGDSPGLLPFSPSDASDRDSYSYTPPPGDDSGIDSGDAQSRPEVPATIDGLALWLDGADSKAVQRVKPGSDETVIKWLDKSPSSPPRHFAQDTRAQAPVYTPGAMGKGALFFAQDKQQFLLGPSFNGLAGAEAFIVFQVAEFIVPNDGGKATYWLWQFGTYASWHPVYYNNTTDSFGLVGTYNAGYWVSPDKFFDPQIFGVISTKQEWTAYVDGKKVFPQPTDQFDGKYFGFNTEGSLLGAGNHVTNNAVPQGYFNGLIAEVIIYDRKLSADNHNAVSAYLSTKWGIALAEPVPDSGP